MDDVDLGGSGRAAAEEPQTTEAKASSLLAEGNAHAAAGRFDAAMASLASALAVDPTNLAVLDALDECRAMKAAANAPPPPEPAPPEPSDEPADQSPRTKGRESAARWEQEGYIGTGGGAATDTTPAPTPRSEPPLFMREPAGGAAPQPQAAAAAAAAAAPASEQAPEQAPEATVPPTEGTGWAGALGKKMGMSDEMVEAMNAVCMNACPLPFLPLVSAARVNLEHCHRF